METIKVRSGFTGLTVGEFTSSPDNDCRMVCLTSRDVTVIRKGLEQFYWKTRYGHYLNPTTFELSDNRTVIELLEELEVKLMNNCFDDAAETIAEAMIASSNSDAILSLADAVRLLAASQCCDTSQTIVNVNGGVNGNLEDGTITYGTVPYVDFPNDIPQGYIDQSHFDSQLCARANALFDGIMHCLLVLCGASSFSAIGATVVLAVGVIGVITLPEVVIPTLIAAMAVAYLASGSLYAVRLELIERKRDFVCFMVSGNNMSVVIESIGELIDIAIAAASVTGPTALAIKTILLVLFSADSLNWLLDAFGGTNYPEADCSDCDDMECPIYLEFLSDTATEELATLTNCVWVNDTVVGTTGAWTDSVVFELLASELFALVGREFNTTDIRLRMTVYLPENAQTQYVYGVNDQTVTYESGNNGSGPQTYYIDWTTTLNEEFERIVFAGAGNTRQFVLSEIIVDIPCESFPT